MAKMQHKAPVIDKNQRSYREMEKKMEATVFGEVCSTFTGLVSMSGRCGGL